MRGWGSAVSTQNRNVPGFPQIEMSPVAAGCIASIGFLVRLTRLLSRPGLTHPGPWRGAEGKRGVQSPGATRSVFPRAWRGRRAPDLPRSEHRGTLSPAGETGSGGQRGSLTRGSLPSRGDCINPRVQVFFAFRRIGNRMDTIRRAGQHTVPITTVRSTTVRSFSNEPRRSA